jgi:drug/metabolite transporter (DMT)-like permease
MIHFIVAAECAKLLTPFAREHLLLDLDPSECFLMNAVIVLVLILCYLGYRAFYHDHKLNMTIKKIRNFSSAQLLFAAFVGCATVLSSMVVLTMDKHYNTPLVNSMLFKIVSIVLLLLIGVVFFKETYSYRQILGLIMAFFGGALIFTTEDGITAIKPKS